MEKNFVEKMKEQLEKEKKVLEKELQGFAEKNKQAKSDWDTHFPNFHGSSLEEEADEVEEYVNLLPVERALEARLSEINLALERVQQGKYGLCEKCGQAIAAPRLETIPEARTCDKCPN
ncbi:MAG: TraR/DksA C4-type zinc finger protein [Candidatus Nealsonbacteria bacterium]|nr:TraR/DksA C4-type zinc finger protein [Candidatus Nealsonbacteria bacterium]